MEAQSRVFYVGKSLSTHIIFHSSSDVELGVPSNVVNAHDNLPHSQSFCSRTTATPT